MGGDELLRETFDRYAERAPRAGADLPDAAREWAARRRRARLTVGGAGLATAAVVAGAVALAPGGPGSTPRPPLATPTHPPVADGMRVVSYHGIEVQLPAHWAKEKTRCGVATEDTYLVWRGPIPLCMARENPDATVAELRPSDYFSNRRDEYLDVEFDAVEVDGVAALRYTARTRDGRDVVGIVLPERSVAVWVRSRDAALAARIVDSVRVVDVDRNGCATRLADGYAPLTPAHPDAASALVPGEPASVAACRYHGDGWLSQSATATDPAPLRDALNALRPGFSPLEDDCEDERDRPHTYLLRFGYADGREHVVRVHVVGCREVGATNGARDGRLSMDLFWRLTEVVGGEQAPTRLADGR